MLQYASRGCLCYIVSISVVVHAQDIAIRGARVVYGTGAAPRIETVLIRGEHIAAVGPDIVVPKGARIIDGQGQTLLPGLVDVHTHLMASAGSITADWQKSMAAYLVSGVTTIDEFSSNREMYAPIRKLIANGEVIAPHINFATRISVPGGHGAESGMGEFVTVEVSTAAAAHEAVKQILPYHPDVIKVFSDGWRYDRIPSLGSMNFDTLSAIVQDAHAAGIKVLTHTLTLNGVKIAAGAGVDIIAHGTQDGLIDDEIIGLMKKHGTAYASTMAVYEPGKPDAPTPAMLAVLEPALREQAEKEIAQKKPLSPDDPILKRWGYLQENLRRLHKAGVPIVAGTDNGMPWTYHGWGSLRELELMVDSGLTPMQAIEAATRVSASALGEDDRGTIEPGKLADLVLVDGNPDENIHDIEKTHTVLLAGRVIDRQKLITSIHSYEMMPLPSREPNPLVDDMERSDLRTNLHTLVIPTTDAGADHSRILYQLVTREDGNHALGVFANMGPRKENYVRLDMPLTEGEVTLADISKYKGVEFDVRGEGSFRLLVNTYDVRTRDYYAAPFAATAQWHTFHIPFSELHSKSDSSSPWNPKSVRGLLFELRGAAGSDEWLELDNVRFF